MKTSIMITESFIETLHTTVTTILVMTPVAVVVGTLLSALIVSFFTSRMMKH